MNPYYDPTKPHHTPKGFRDPAASPSHKSFRDVVAWKRQSSRDGLPPPPKAPTPVVAPDLARIAGAETSATFIGHSSFLIRVGGLTILTDPVFSERASPLAFLGPKRQAPPGIAFAELPQIDLVLISHGHYDHLDRASVRALARRRADTLFIVPLGVGALLNRWGIDRVVELDWWQEHRHSGLDIVLTPARHWSARSFNDRNRTLWGAFAVFAEGFACYFGGDSGYGEHFTETRDRLAGRRPVGSLFDLALLPIGAYEPRWFMAEHHMNPEDAVLAHRDLDARQSIAMHWGTFQLTDEALDEPPERLAMARAAAGLSDTDFLALPVGGSWWLPV